MTSEKVVETKTLVPWISFLIFFAVLNETMFNVSTTNVMAEFHLTKSGVSWLMTIFMVFMGIGSVIFGRLSDLFSLRRLIVIGIVTYCVGSLMGYLLQFSYPLVILSRAIQGIGCSAIPALVFVVIARYVDPAKRGGVFGLITSVVTVSINVGPVVGGFVSGTFHWAYLFLVPIVILVAIPYFLTALPNEERKEGSVDLIGATLVAATVGFLVVALNLGDWYYYVGFAVSLTLLIVRMYTAKDPFIQPDLFKNTKFRDGVIVGFCLFSIVIGAMFLIPIMLADVQHLATNLIGLILLPGLVNVVLGPLGGRLADSKGNSFVVTIGLVALVGSLLLLSVLMNSSLVWITVAILVMFVGFSLFQTAMINSISQTLPEHETGIGMGIFNLVAIESGAIGTAIVGKLLDTKILQFPMVPFVSSGFDYANLLVAFAVVTILGGWLYLSSYRGEKPIVLKSDAAES